MAAQSVDVVVVGLGAAGSILARDLARAGLRVVGLERGPMLATKDFEAQDELRFFQRGDLRPDPKRLPITWRPNAQARALPVGVQNYGYGAGGGTVHYGAVSWRLHEQNFRTRSANIARYGPQSIPEDSSVIDWPLTYAELEPYYDRAEYEIGISGNAGNIQGRIVEGGNPFEAPRARDYPMPALAQDRNAERFGRAARSLGYHPFPTPRAILSRPYQGRPGCTYCGFCQGFGCHVGAKSSALVTSFPEALATGNFEARTGAMVYRINSDASGRVTGVSYYGPDESDQTIDAEIVILATFTYDNVRLPLLSATDRFPNGLANSSGHLGKHFMAHLGARSFAAFDDEYSNLFMGPSAGRGTIDDLESDNFDHTGLGFIQGGQVSLAGAAIEHGPIGTALSLTPPAGMRRWGAEWRDFFARYYPRFLAISSFVENLPYPDQTIDLDPNVRDRFGLPAPRLTYDWRRPAEQARQQFINERVREIAQALNPTHIWTPPAGGAAPGAHQEGGARMGDSPANSVVNKYSQSWDHPNLFIVGSSAFPTMSGFNPTETIQALAYYTSDALVSRYVKSPGPLV